LIFLKKGWNSWNHYACQINEAVIRQTADAMVASGLLKAGYQYGKSFRHKIHRFILFLLRLK